MTSKHAICRNFDKIRIKQEPITYKKPTAIKEEYNEDNTIANIFSDREMTTTSRYSRAVNHAHVKQETMSETDPNLQLEYFYDSSYINYDAAIKPDVSVQMDTDSILPTTQYSKPLQNCDKEENIKIIYTCCKKIFYDQFQHFHHMIGHVEEQLTCIKCDYCSKLFKSPNDMKIHIQAKHTGYNCMYCHILRFPRKHMLLEHLKNYHGYEPRYQNYSNRYNNSQWQRSPWDNSYKPKRPTFRSKYKWNQKSSSKFKMEQRSPPVKNSHSKVKTEPLLSNVKTEPLLSNVKTEPLLSNFKMEPLFSNVKMEPLFSNIKTEPT